MFLVTFVVPALRERALVEIERGFDSWDGLKAIGSIIATFGLMAMYGVIAGVFVMGLAGFLRGNRVELPESNGALSEQLG